MDAVSRSRHVAHHWDEVGFNDIVPYERHQQAPRYG
jgi:hypothetical protein